MLPQATNLVVATRRQVANLGRGLEFDLGTVAGMKTEMHAASLILESYGGISEKFDVSLSLGYITGIAPTKLKRLPKMQRGQMRNLYVAMSRPTTLFCNAANQSRVSQSVRDALEVKGWHIEIVT